MLNYQIVRIGVAATSLSLAAMLIFTGAAFASGGGGLSGGGGNCADSGNTVGCSAGTGGSSGTGSSGGTGIITTGDNSGGSAAVPTCPNYVPYPQGGPPPAGENPNGAWYLNTCAVGSEQGMATGLVWILTSQIPPPRTARPGGGRRRSSQRAAAGLADNDVQPGHQRLRELPGMVMDQRGDLASVHHFGDRVQRGRVHHGGSHRHARLRDLGNR